MVATAPLPAGTAMAVPPRLPLESDAALAARSVLIPNLDADEDEVRRALAFYRAHRARQRLAAQRRAKAKKGTR